ncbi:hypothetical protein WJX81_002566 [Elliptochloris bilobata]|uniref:Metallo-beta-lactamase domain-containing protein n=1 Tax=Elliptochloris bilobata TaxID=381761 RepID=A0AAW1QZG4_9CHLO
MAEQVESIKWIPNTRFLVDGFRFQSPRCSSYFLTHMHGDHYCGLTKSFGAGHLEAVIYCSKITAALLTHDFGLPPRRVRALPMDQPVSIDGVRVTLIDANHCPGAVMFFFDFSHRTAKVSPEAILHTGDMRWHARMGQHPALCGRRIDLLLMDTTYGAPKHVHPPQEEAVALIVDTMRKEVAARPRTLFVVGSYRIGKERAYLGAARAMGWRVFCNADKRKVLGLLDLPAADMALVTGDKKAARVHVVAMGQAQMSPEALTSRCTAAGYSHVVGFRPTGWTFRKSGGLEVRREGCATIYGVPYSEHSNFEELRDCVRTLHPSRLVPTVNAANMTASRAMVDKFADLMDLRKDRSRLDHYLRPAATAPPASERQGSDHPTALRGGDPPAAQLPHSRSAPLTGDCGSAGGASEAMVLADVDLVEQQRLQPAVKPEMAAAQPRKWAKAAPAAPCGSSKRRQLTLGSFFGKGAQR